jgi:eukaryotic-like serine/threonine-protein kinase
MMIKIYTGFLLILFLHSNLLAQKGVNWPVFRGDAELRGYADVQISTPLELAWTYQAKDDFVAAPVIAGNRILAGSIDGKFYALDIKGNLIWQFETDNSIEAPGLYLDGVIYFGNLSGMLYALNASDGRLLWKYETENQIMGSPNFFSSGDKHYIIVGSYDYYLHCIDATTGKGLWKYESDNFVNGAAAITGMNAIFGGCDGFLHVVDLIPGRENRNSK